MNDAQRTYGGLFWVSTVGGWLLIANGARLLLDDPEANWKETARLFAIGIVAHDVVWLSVSIGLGWLLARLLGREIPFWIRWASWSSVVLIALAFPLVRRYGDRFGNDTILVRDYGVSLAILLAIVWAGGAAYGAGSSRRASRAASRRSSG